MEVLGQSRDASIFLFAELSGFSAPNALKKQKQAAKSNLLVRLYHTFFCNVKPFPRSNVIFCIFNKLLLCILYIFTYCYFQFIVLYYRYKEVETPSSRLKIRNTPAQKHTR